eukprot:gb/GECG01015290.1/.p1 GENE.gb/GECG01015290.1/~~gb/GECG01015290.1/.p1  ORF type:complete len:688 (+),score=93.39 gb/GECG01015290.1/:1-2064(+)
MASIIPGGGEERKTAEDGVGGGGGGASSSRELFPVYFVPKKRNQGKIKTRHVLFRWRQDKGTLHVVNEAAEEAARQVFKEALEEGNSLSDCLEYIHVKPNKPELFVTFRTQSQADTLVEKLHCQHVSPFCGQGKLATCTYVTAKYATSVEAAKSNLEDTALSQNVFVPGLYTCEEFITPEEEQQLLQKLGQAEWDTSMASRRVQHYGLKFNYVKRAIDLDDTSVPPLSGLMKTIGERIKEKGYSPHEFNQVTVNEYPPGAGISPHVDTKEVFDECIASVTLHSHGVMEFRNVVNGENQGHTENHSHTMASGYERAFQVAKLGVPGARVRQEAENSGDSLETMHKDIVNGQNGENKCNDTAELGSNYKQQPMNRRSLVAMTGDARYKWTHAISARKRDLIDGTIHDRGTRVSLTYRKVIQQSNEAAYTPHKLFSPALQSNSVSHDSERTASDDDLKTPIVEAEHVHKLYDAIAPHFSHTRHSGWPSVNKLVEEQPPGSLVADVGCGNGKYLGLNPSIMCIGSDKSVGLTAICGERGFEAFTSDCLKVPWRSNTADLTLCIAVMHHLSTVRRRRQCIEELARITCAGGRIMIQAWAFEQSPTSRRQFVEQDVMVPWNLDRKLVSVSAEEISRSHAVVDEERDKIVFQRYCHVYRQGEIEGLIEELDCQLIIERSWWEKGNWCIVATKQS